MSRQPVTVLLMILVLYCVNCFDGSTDERGTKFTTIEKVIMEFRSTHNTEYETSDLSRSELDDILASLLHTFGCEKIDACEVCVSDGDLFSVFDLSSNCIINYIYTIIQ